MFSRAASVFGNLPAPRILRDQLGNSLVEYALLLSLIALTGLFGMKVLGSTGSSILSDVSTQLTASASNSPSSGKGEGAGNNSDNGNGKGDGGGSRKGD